MRGSESIQAKSEYVCESTNELCALLMNIQCEDDESNSSSSSGSPTKSITSNHTQGKRIFVRGSVLPYSADQKVLLIPL